MSVSSQKSKIPVFQRTKTKKTIEVQKKLDATVQPNPTPLNKKSDFNQPKLTESKFTKTEVKSHQVIGKSAPPLKSITKGVQNVKSGPKRFKEAHSISTKQTKDNNSQKKIEFSVIKGKSTCSRIKSPPIGVNHAHTRIKPAPYEVNLIQRRVKSPLTEVKTSLAQKNSPVPNIKSPLAELKGPLTEANLPNCNIDSLQTNAKDSVGVKQDDQDVQFEPDQKALESILNNQGILPDFKTTPKAMSGQVTCGVTPTAANRMSMWDSYNEFKINWQKHKAMLQQLNIETSFQPDSKALSTILNGQGISSTTTGVSNRSSMYTTSSRTMMQSYLDHKENVKLLKETLQLAEKGFVTPHKGVGITTATTPVGRGLLTPVQQLSTKRNVHTPAHRVAFPTLSEAEENEVTPDQDQPPSKDLEKRSNNEQWKTLHSGNNHNQANNVLPPKTDMYSESSSMVKTSGILSGLSTQKSSFTPNQVSNKILSSSSVKFSCDKTNGSQSSLGSHNSTTPHYRKELFPSSMLVNMMKTPSPNRKHLLSRTPITGSAARVPVRNCQTPTATGIKAPPMRIPVLSSCLKNTDVSKARPEMLTVSASKTLRWADGHRISQNY